MERMEYSKGVGLVMDGRYRVQESRLMVGREYSRGVGPVMEGME